MHLYLHNLTCLPWADHKPVCGVRTGGCTNYFPSWYECLILQNQNLYYPPWDFIFVT